MRIDFIGLAENDIDTAAIGLPSGNAGREMLIGVRNALVMLFLIFVRFGVRSGVAALPEGLDEIVAFFVVGELPESRALLVCDDPDHVLIEPFLIGLAQFLFEGALILLPLFLVGGALERIHCIIVRLRLGGLSLRRRRCSRVAGGLLGRLLVGLLVLGDGTGQR